MRLELREIKEAIQRDAENNLTWKAFFSSRPNLKRIGLCTATAVFSQSTGNLLVSNYLNPILKQTGLDSDFESTLINGMVTLWSYLISIACCFLMNTFRRRSFFLWGSGGTLVVFIAWTVGAQQFTEHGNIAAGRLVVACIFLFQFFYVVAWQVLVVTYPLELVTYQMRAKMWSYVLLVIYVAQIFGNYVNPIGLESIGWKYYIYLCVWISMIWLTVYFFFVETKGPTLEELELIFDKKALGDVEKVEEDEIADEKARHIPENVETVRHKE